MIKWFVPALFALSTSAAAAEKYALITVMDSGQVSYSHGYENLHMCEEAKSMARTGRTIEQNAEASRHEKAEAEARLAEFQKKYPPRNPTNSAEDQRLVKEAKAGATGITCGSSRFDVEQYYNTHDSLIHTRPALCWSSPSVMYSYNPAMSLKAAECIVDDQKGAE